MSTQPEDLYDDNDNPDTGAPADESSVIQQLRRQTKQQASELKALREQAQQAETLQRENALYKANLGDLNEAQQQAVLATSKEMTADALRSQAELLGFVEPPAPTVPAGDIEAFDRVAEATAGGGMPDALTYEAEIAAARDDKEVLAIMAKYGSPVVKYD